MVSAARFSHRQDLSAATIQAKPITRKEEDADLTKIVIVDTAKLVGNSHFGKTIVDKDKHSRVLYVDRHAAASNL